MAWRGFDESADGDGFSAPTIDSTQRLSPMRVRRIAHHARPAWPTAHVGLSPDAPIRPTLETCELKFILDFDGVLFNSAFEAYSVCNQTVLGKAGYRQDVTFEEFLAFRSVVVDAWQYNRLYLDTAPQQDAALQIGLATKQDRTFADRFFATRAAIMRDPDWPRIMHPYDFFFLLKPLLLQFPDRFAILSTRNLSSIHETLAFFGADVVSVFGQEHIRHLGSKLAVAQAQGWLERGRHLAVYIDDMTAHLEPFDGKVHLPLHANWGYDKDKTGSLNPHQIITIIRSLLKLAEPEA